MVTMPSLSDSAEPQSWYTAAGPRHRQSSWVLYENICIKYHKRHYMYRVLCRYILLLTHDTRILSRLKDSAQYGGKKNADKQTSDKVRARPDPPSTALDPVGLGPTPVTRAPTNHNPSSRPSPLGGNPRLPLHHWSIFSQVISGDHQWLHGPPPLCPLPLLTFIVQYLQLNHMVDKYPVQSYITSHSATIRQPHRRARHLHRIWCTAAHQSIGLDASWRWCVCMYAHALLFMAFDLA